MVRTQARLLRLCGGISVSITELSGEELSVRDPEKKKLKKK